MSDIAIKIENVSKLYNLGEVSTGTLSHDLNRLWYKIRGKPDPYLKIGETNDRTTKGASDFIWALKDINFEIKKGDRVGIIGKNGAGKSTLLKILSKVTGPTTGQITIKGRCSSLLEVGTGFHPELSGRDNIYMNGAILGMSRTEITRKLDEIIDFSGIQKFINTPVKRYSSGMYVRLAFSVAAHLNSDILILDEVLAVGDAEFQNKCLGKMDDVSKKQGRTILFVSHNMQAIKNLCAKCILLDKGLKTYEGDTETTLTEYNNILRYSRLKANKGEYNVNRRGSGTISFTDIEILDNNNGKRNIFNIGEIVRFRMDFLIHSQVRGLHVGVWFKSPSFDILLTGATYEVKEELLFENEKGSAIMEFDLSTIRPGEYNLYFWLGDTAALTQGNPINYDVVDNMTEPLVVKARDKEEQQNKGFFSLPTRMTILQ